MLVASAIVAIGSCASPDSRNTPLDVPRIDSARIGAVDDVLAWSYRRATKADLDGDGSPENVVLVADVQLTADGKPLWEDGHRWAAFVESSSGQRTLIYGAFVPRGFAEAAVTAADDQARRRVLIQERTPEQLVTVEVEYRGPGRIRTSSSAHYQLEQWLPGSATLP